MEFLAGVEGGKPQNFVSSIV